MVSPPAPVSLTQSAAQTADLVTGNYRADINVDFGLGGTRVFAKPRRQRGFMRSVAYGEMVKRYPKRPNRVPDEMSVRIPESADSRPSRARLERGGSTHNGHGLVR